MSGLHGSVALGLLTVNLCGESHIAPARLDLQSTPAETPGTTTGMRFYNRIMMLRDPKEGFRDQVYFRLNVVWTTPDSATSELAW